MVKICQELVCDLILHLGEKFYPNDINSIEEPQLKEQIEQLYRKINKLLFTILGYHDVK